mmetsp:Transcript_5586/g.10475  ORF Transcript_5586/g.10475 Transcript_5586/m.10475 type:complete len:201 (-) Transcript_5586:1813-2415(-)
MKSSIASKRLDAVPKVQVLPPQSSGFQSISNTVLHSDLIRALAHNTIRHIDVGVQQQLIKQEAPKKTRSPGDQDRSNTKWTKVGRSPESAHGDIIYFFGSIKHINLCFEVNHLGRRRSTVVPLLDEQCELLNGGMREEIHDPNILAKLHLDGLHQTGSKERVATDIKERVVNHINLLHVHNLAPNLEQVPLQVCARQRTV